MTRRGAAWPFAARESELDAVGEAMVRASGALLLGAPGVGKTRLAAEAVARAGKQGASTLWIAATAATTPVPLGAVAHLLRPSPTPTDQLGRMFQQTAGELLDRAGDRRLVIGLDDAPHLDETTAALIHHLVTGAGARAIITCRAGDALPGPLAALRKGDYLWRRELGTFSEPQVGQLLTRVLGNLVATETVHRLTTTTGGNALYLRELVTGGIDGGMLAERSGVWSWRGGVPTARLRELVELRLDDIAPHDLGALEVLACCGPLEHDLLAEVAPEADLEMLEARSLLAAVAAVDDGQPPRLRLAHPLYADVVRDGLGSLRRRRIHARAAEALDRRTRRPWPADALRLATWRLAAGDRTRPDDLVAGGWEAQAAGDAVTAERLARGALDAGGADKTGRTTEGTYDAEAKYLLAVALSGQGRVDEARRVLDELEHDADVEEQARLTIAAAMDEFWWGSRYAEGWQTLERAEWLVRRSGSADLVHGLAAARTGFLALSGSASEALDTARLVLGDPTARTLHVLRTAVVNNLAAALAGRRDAFFDRVDELQVTARDEALQVGGTNLLPTSYALADRLAGRLDRALATAEQGLTDSMQESGLSWMPYMLWLTNLGQVSLARGHVDDAIRWLREAVATFEEVGRSVFLDWSRFHLVQALAQAGEADEAARLLAETEDGLDPTLRTLAHERHLAVAWVAAARGECTRAAEAALTAAAMARDVDQFAVEVNILGDALRLGAAAPAAARLEELTTLVDGPLARILADLAGALAAGDAAGVERAAGRLEELGALLRAAEAWAEAGRLHHAAGRRSSARQATARSTATAGRCPGARTPALSRLHDVPVLTRREREVAGMAARGVPNPAIAEQLHVSVRTVENHLHNVYGKLGATGREELRALISGW